MLCGGTGIEYWMDCFYSDVRMDLAFTMTPCQVPHISRSCSRQNPLWAKAQQNIIQRRLNLKNRQILHACNISREVTCTLDCI